MISVMVMTHRQASVQRWGDGVNADDEARTDMFCAGRVRCNASLCTFFFPSASWWIFVKQRLWNESKITTLHDKSLENTTVVFVTAGMSLADIKARLLRLLCLDVNSEEAADFALTLDSKCTFLCLLSLERCKCFFPLQSRYSR